MAVLEILQFPDPRLREKCIPVTAVDVRIRKIFEDMAETMYDAPGVGLAAAQVGVAERLIVVDVGDDEDEGREARLYKMANPEIVHREGKLDYEEGCLSIPGIKDLVKRSAAVVVQGLDENGKEVEVEAEGLLAVCFQHEIDHLDGILFIDHLSRLKRELITSKITKRKRP